MSEHTPQEAWPANRDLTLMSADPTLVGGAPPAPPDAPLSPYEPPPSNRMGWELAVGLIVLLLAGLGAGLAWWLTHRTSSEAATTVVTTFAQPTTTVAGGAGAVAVPDVRGLPLPQAEARLRALGFKTVVTSRVPSTQPAGAVLKEAPLPNVRLARGSTIGLTVAAAAGASGQATTPPSTGATTPTVPTTAPATTSVAPPQPQTVSVPDLTGSDVQHAVQRLLSANLLATIAYVPAGDPLGAVEAQAPAAGASAPARSHVTVNASAGKGTSPQARVPNVVGQTLQQAVSTLNGAHLRLIYLKRSVSTQTQAGKVVEQTPAAAKQAPENAQVLVYLGAFRPAG